MVDDVIRLSVFLACAAVLWLASTRFYMRSYGPQPVSGFDRLFLPAALAMAGLYDVTVAPLLVGALDIFRPLVADVRSLFSQAHPLVQLITFLVTTDFLAYWAHRFMHTRWAWRFHAFHHSPTSLNWFSGTRGSPVHFILTLAPSTLMSSLFLFSEARWIFFATLLFDVVSQHLSHSNIQLPFARALERVIVTPRMHFVHHHPNVIYTNTNYGFYFSIWDRLFGTYVDADDVKEPGLVGLDYENTKLRFFLGLDPKLPDPAPAKSALAEGR
jgi:sterol desaturase/sphingolipid hydroxylase (fatty acid hydroxylase superfamily)